MYEPKYKLNKLDEARWKKLLTRHCANYVDIRGKQHVSRKFPPLTATEELEFERLSRKRSRKIAKHPKVAVSIHLSRQLSQQASGLLRRADRVLASYKK